MGSSITKEKENQEDVGDLRNNICRLLEENQKLKKENEQLKMNKKRKREDDDEEEQQSKKIIKMNNVINGNDEEEERTFTYIESIETFHNEETDISICFSGFKNNTKTFNKQLKKDLVEKLKKIEGVTVVPETEDREILDESITHVIASPNARTMKVLQGVLMGKWIMTTKWVTHLTENPHSRDFASFGFCRSENPISEKKIFLSNSFLNKWGDEITMKHCELLIKFGQAIRVYDLNIADFCLIGPTDTSLIKSSHLYNAPNSAGFPVLQASSHLTERQIITQEHPSVFVADWTEFIDLLFPPYYETFMRRIENI